MRRRKREEEDEEEEERVLSKHELISTSRREVRSLKTGHLLSQS